MAIDALTWLHLSDLHFGHGGERNRLDQEMICTAILADAEVIKGKLGPPDWIFVTGDIAFKGAPEEYRKAAAWLEQLAQTVGVGRELILLVPGNHDVDRALATGKISARLVHEHLRTHPGALDDSFSDPTAMDGVWNKLSAYADFAKVFGPPKIAPDKDRPWWVHESPSPIGEIVLLGLNTVLVSFEDREQGQLPLGNRQQQAIQHAPADRLLLLLQHHPQDWLYDGDDELGWLGHRPHLLFCGHVHRPNGLLYLPLDRQGHVTLVAGAGHADPKDPPEHAYDWGRLSSAGLEYLPRLWIDRHKQFRADHNRFDSMDAEGVVRLALEQLPPPLRDWLRGQPPPPPPPTPQWQTDADAALRSHIQGYLGNLRAACNRLPIKAIDPKVSFGGASFTLAAVYCGLTAAPPPEPEIETEQRESIAIEERLAQPQYRFTLLGGDLGSGKTTVLCHLAHQLAGSGTAIALPSALAGRVPVLVALDGALDTIAEARDGNADLIWSLVERAWQEKAPDSPNEVSFDVVRRQLKRDGLFLIDGLDELTQSETKPYRSRLLDALSAFAVDLAEEDNGRARVLVTARPYSVLQQPPRFRRLDLLPMNPAQIRQFITNWYRAAGAARSWDDDKTDARIGALIEAIAERPFLQELAERPLLLTLIAGFNDRYQTFPKNRAVLFESAVDRPATPSCPPPIRRRPRPSGGTSADSPRTYGSAVAGTWSSRATSTSSTRTRRYART